MEDNLYTRLAKAGWLGTKAEVSAKYGHPAWKNEGSADAYKQALLNQQKKQKPDASEGGA